MHTLSLLSSKYRMECRAQSPKLSIRGYFKASITGADDVSAHQPSATSDHVYNTGAGEVNHTVGGSGLGEERTVANLNILFRKISH